jgi:hypothetical protein
MFEFVAGVSFSFIGVGIYTYIKEKSIEAKKIKFIKNVKSYRGWNTTKDKNKV